MTYEYVPIYACGMSVSGALVLQYDIRLTDYTCRGCLPYLITIPNLTVAANGRKEDSLLPHLFHTPTQIPDHVEAPHSITRV